MNEDQEQTIIKHKESGKWRGESHRRPLRAALRRNSRNDPVTGFLNAGDCYVF